MTAQASKPISKTLGEDAYHQIRTDLLCGRMKPGERLPLRALSSRYGFGIAPLREAMSRLASERLVDFEGQRGFRVTPIDVDDLEDLAEQRINLYLSALERSIRNGDEAWECDVLVAFHMLEKAERPANRADPQFYDEWEQRHERFHEGLISACGSRWLIHFCRILSEQYGRYRRYLTLEMSASDEHWARIRQDHKALMDYAFSGNVEAALATARTHFEENVRQLLSVYRAPAETKPASRRRGTRTERAETEAGWP